MEGILTKKKRIQEAVAGKDSSYMPQYLPEKRVQCQR
jgi:hypothetical protein